MPFEDGFGRVHDELRISITDRCNLRCAYCMPVEPVWFDRKEILTYEEIASIARAAAAGGVRRFRITGGEPLVRREVESLVAMLAATPGLEDLGMTTNGALLAPMANRLADAGLRRINVSLDTLRPERFRSLTGRDALRDVLDGIEAASRAGLRPVKVNAVLLRGVNDDEATDLVAFARGNGLEMRFIEFMPLENDGTWNPARVVTGAEVRRAIASLWPMRSDPGRDPRAAAERYLFEDGTGAVGFIDSVSAPFCGTCSRLRLTSDGKFRVCLYDPAEIDLKTQLRAGTGKADLTALIEAAVRRKGRGGALEILDRRAALPITRTMHQIGG